MKYHKIPFKIIKSNHILVKAKINGIKGTFIIDTGASNCCVCFENKNKFLLHTHETDTKAAGAGAINLETLASAKNKLEIYSWKNKDFNLILINMKHIKQSLQNFYKKPIDGVLGADVLIASNANIDYKNKLLLLEKK